MCCFYMRNLGQLFIEPTDQTEDGGFGPADRPPWKKLRDALVCLVREAHLEGEQAGSFGRLRTSL
jgi:hypothetical protein